MKWPPPVHEALYPYRVGIRPVNYVGVFTCPTTKSLRANSRSRLPMVDARLVSEVECV